MYTAVAPTLHPTPAPAWPPMSFPAHVGDERAEEVLANGRAFLQACAQRVHDPSLRHTFLENIPSHQTILNL